MILITFALKSEGSVFVRLVRHRKKSADRHIIEGELGERDVTVLHTGVGKLAATERITSLLERKAPHLVISSGFVGAVRESYVPGKLFLAQNFSSPDLLSAAAKALPNAATGDLKTISSIVDSSEARAALARDYGADVVDMETQFIAAACGNKGIPMLSLRAISDTPELPFPAPPDVLFDIARQRTSLTRVGLYLAANPTALPGFMKFARQIAAARSTLADALQLLLTTGAI